MPVCHFVRHKNVEIFEVHFENLDPEKALPAIEEVKRVVAMHPKNSIRALTNVSNSHFDARVNQALREMTAANKPFVRRSAVVGVSGVQQMMLSGIRILTGRDIRGFDDAEAARDWLVVDAED
jgi:hypothetical protein